uniref:Putative zinc finger CCCH domain-containing protein 48-like isoform X1 n=1 Tax=Davidia involucrata TaxID=16924 RepID=A0A5B7CBV0_DAVIN
MDTKAATRVSERTERTVFNRLRGHVNNKVCAYWLAGRCSRSPCRFLHRELPPSKPKQLHRESSQQHNQSEDRHYSGSKTWRRSPDYGPKKSSIPPSGEAGSGGKSTQKTQEKVCKYWISGNCVQGDKCQDLHSWFCGNGFSMLANLVGHNKAVTGIALPSGSNKLYSGSMDKSVRVWDCNTGQCAAVANLEGEIGCLISEGPLVFVGLPNAVKAWNTSSCTELTLNGSGSVGKVYAMVVHYDMLLAGTEDGTILAWKSSSETNCPELSASLKGHSCGVVSLVIGANRLYSGSMDHTIRVWDLDTLQCIQTLNGHMGAVMSVLCWDSFLLSGSLDGTIKVWVATEGGNLEVTYTHNVEHGVLVLCGIHDAEAKPILLCSCNDNSVRLYELPSFTERGTIFAKQEVRAIQIGPRGLFFTGDTTGQITIWKLSGE